jgi:hypothetical protein
MNGRTRHVARPASTILLVFEDVILFYCVQSQAEIEMHRLVQRECDRQLSLDVYLGEGFDQD